MPIRMRIHKGDTVMIISGDDRGKTGKVLKVFPEESRVIVEKVNFVKRHTRPTTRSTQGGIQEKEAPIHVSNVQVIDPKTGEPTRVGKRRLEDGSRERYGKKSGESLPTPGR
jgi:large subunit ribosomal protein L24